MVREARYLGDNTERFLPPNRRVQPDGFGEDWIPSHQPEDRGGKTPKGQPPQQKPKRGRPRRRPRD